MLSWPLCSHDIDHVEQRGPRFLWGRISTTYRFSVLSNNWKCRYICFLKLTCKGLINLNLVMKSVGNLLPFQSFVIPKITHLLYLMRFLLAVRLGRDWSGRLAVPHINIYLMWGVSDMPPLCDEVMWSPDVGNSLTNEANWWVFDDKWGIKWIQLQTL